MWLQILLALIGVYLVLKIYKFAIKPYKEFKYYKNQLKEKNYRAYVYPFVPGGVPMLLDSPRD